MVPSFIITKECNLPLSLCLCFSLISVSVVTSALPLSHLLCLCHICSASDLPAFPLQSPCDYIGPTQMFQDNVSTSGSFMQSHLPKPPCSGKQHFHGSWGSGRGPLHLGTLLKVNTVSLLSLKSSNSSQLILSKSQNS